MGRLIRTVSVTFALAAIAAALPVVATPADQVRARIAGYRQLGDAYKAVTDGLRANDIGKVRQAAGQIGNVPRAMYGWFPAGSGPRPGVRTKAKPDIWTRPREFRAAQDAFAREAQAFQRAAATGNLDVVRGQARKLGASCKGCHDQFREQQD